MSLDISIISSFAPKGVLTSDHFQQVKEAVQQSRGGITIGLDAYMFMEADAAHLDSGNPNRHSAFQFLSKKSSDSAPDIAKQLLSKSGSSPLVALTSFLPEISQYANDTDESSIVDAISGLLEIAVHIGAASGNTPVIQMVAGNMLKRIEPEQETNDKKTKELEDAKNSNGESELHRSRFFIVAADENDSYRVILNRLALSLDRLAEKFNNQEKELATVHSLRIAFEMEPGPLYLLDGPRSLLRFCHLIESHTSPLVRKCVGFNLDIAHWWLKNITPDFLDQPYQFLDRRSPNNEPSVTAFGHAAPNLKNRIFHSHISGHSRRAHFGDISLTRMVEEDKQLYCQWLTKLIELVQQDGSRFSSYVSLEYEAARNLQCVIESADELVNLLAQAQDKYASSRPN